MSFDWKESRSHSDYVTSVFESQGLHKKKEKERLMKEGEQGGLARLKGDTTRVGIHTQQCHEERRVFT